MGGALADTLNAYLLAHWAGNADPAVVGGPDEVWAGTELIRRAAGAAAWLDELGAPEGGPVPALLDESPAAIAIALGASLSGRSLAPLGTKLPADELALAMAGLGAGLLVGEPARAELAGEVARRTGAQLALVERAPEPVDLTAPRGSPDDVAAVIHTSGTTGTPRPVLMRHAPLVARTRIYSSAIELGPGDRYCSASPYHHVAGMGMALVALAAGAAVIPCPGFTPAEWRRLRSLDPTHALLVPTMIDRLLAEGDLDASLHVLQYGAAPIHPDTLAEAIRAAPSTRLIQIFGQTEVSPITVLSHDDHVRAASGDTSLLRSVGRPLPEVELQIEDPDAEGIGELVVRAPHAFDADADGWRRTGDLGCLDPEGYVFLHGRRNDRIVRGGENIYPVEIEAVLVSHPEVVEACVVGVPDRRWGEVVKAVVVTRPGAEVTAAALQAHVRDRLAHFKVPALIEFTRELPRTPSGKVLRRALV
ncbi:MAG: acyl--CoA ligase [Acidimicrobiia bacterium]|nr:acyl--CoA ligase [Acidimicrobiia bacterium]